MLRRPPPTNSTLEIDAPSPNPPATNAYESKANKILTKESRKLILLAGLILGLTIFSAAMSIMEDNFVSLMKWVHAVFLVSFHFICSGWELL
jgi:hypothetical protein